MAVSRRTLLRAGLGTGLAAGLAHVSGSRGQTPVALRDLAARKGVRFGAAVDGRTLALPDAARILAESCASLTARNALKWPTVEPNPGVQRWTEVDKIVAFAQQHRMACYGHTLIWFHVPYWVKALTEPAALRAAMQSRIEAAMQRHPHAIDTWDVVNEPLEYDKPVMRNSVFQQVLGSDHIADSFRMAHAAQPAAKLVLNETHLEKTGEVYAAKRARILEIVRKLRDDGVAIDGVGMQGHFRPGLDTLDEAGVEQFCHALKQMGLAVYITELDASCRFAGKLGNRGDTIYDEAFGRFVAAAGRTGALRGLTLWNMLEGQGDTEPKPRPGCTSLIGLYDAQLRPRGTLDTLTRALEGIADA